MLCMQIEVADWMGVREMKIDRAGQDDNMAWGLFGGVEKGRRPRVHVEWLSFSFPFRVFVFITSIIMSQIIYRC